MESRLETCLRARPRLKMKLNAIPERNGGKSLKMKKQKKSEPGTAEEAGIEAAEEEAEAEVMAEAVKAAEHKEEMDVANVDTESVEDKNMENTNVFVVPTGTITLTTQRYAVTNAAITMM